MCNVSMFTLRDDELVARIEVADECWLPDIAIEGEFVDAVKIALSSGDDDYDLGEGRSTLHHDEKLAATVVDLTMYARGPDITDPTRRVLYATTVIRIFWIKHAVRVNAILAPSPALASESTPPF